MPEPPQSRRIPTSNPASYSSPSVPISVYKQLAGELNVVKAEVTALKSENQQLRTNNQKLQNQVHQVIQAAEHLKQMVNRYDFGAETYQVQVQNITTTPSQPQPSTPAVMPPAAQPQLPAASAPQLQKQPLRSPQPPTVMDGNGAVPNPYTPQPPVKPIATMAPPELPATEEVEGGINGWVILLMGIAIILTAFGAGYMVVLPLLNNSNDTAQ